MAVGIRADDHVAVVVAVQIGDFAQQGNGYVEGGEAFGSPAAVRASCSLWWRWAGSSGMLTLLERCVGDLAK